MHRNYAEWYPTHFSSPRTIQHSEQSTNRPRLSDAAELDLNSAKLDIKQKGYVGSEVLSRFRWKYNVQPSEMTQIWYTIVLHIFSESYSHFMFLGTRCQATTMIHRQMSRFENAIGLFRERLVSFVIINISSVSNIIIMKCLSHTAQLRVPKVPDRYMRPASPVSSDYSASTDDAPSFHDNILAEIQALRDELRVLDNKVSDPPPKLS